jgi:hypothetical protein
VWIPRCTCSPRAREEQRRWAEAARARRVKQLNAKLEELRIRAEIEKEKTEVWLARQRAKEARAAALGIRRVASQREEDRRRVPTTQPVEKAIVRSTELPYLAPLACFRGRYYWRSEPWYTGSGRTVWIPRRYSYSVSQPSGGGTSTWSPGYTVTRTIMVRR